MTILHISEHMSNPTTNLCNTHTNFSKYIACRIEKYADVNWDGDKNINSVRQIVY